MSTCNLLDSGNTRISTDYVQKSPWTLLLYLLLCKAYNVDVPNSVSSPVPTLFCLFVCLFQHGYTLSSLSYGYWNSVGRVYAHHYSLLVVVGVLYNSFILKIILDFYKLDLNFTISWTQVHYTFTFVMPLPLLYLKTIGHGMCLV